MSYSLDQVERAVGFWYAKCRLKEELGEHLNRFMNGGKTFFQVDGLLQNPRQLLDNPRFQKACYKAFRKSIQPLTSTNSEVTKELHEQLVSFPERCFHDKGLEALVEVHLLLVKNLKERMKVAQK